MTAWVAVTVAILFGACVKGVTGFGLPPVAIPVMAAFIGVEEAVVVMALPNVVTNLTLVADHWEHRRANEVLPRMLVAAVVGAFVGSWLLTSLDERVIAVVVAVLVVVFVVRRSVDRTVAIDGRQARRLSVPVGLFGGMTQGAAGLAAPVLATFLQGQALVRPVFVFSIAALFLVSSTAQLTGFVVLGRYGLRALGLGVLASVLAVAVMVALRPFADRLSNDMFDRIVLVVLVASSAKMLYDAVA